MGKLGGNLRPNPCISSRPLVNQPSSAPSASVQPLTPPSNDKGMKVSKDTSSSKKRKTWLSMRIPKLEVVIPHSPLVLFGQGG
ncbi:hypothetical protein PanWU01x14_030010 [Parasponia andersonii]|uniref:Uncharacterized protein n=1 Tax=Parasponia andersonii TaxID=3476 RepID=A0A2P5DUM2_PARAD|nr:hypothetical protein PanWU01x14_030010 [Parasponia andersonii]